MRILFASIGFSPDHTGLGKYTADAALWLAARGHEVRAVSAPVCYPSWTPEGKLPILRPLVQHVSTGCGRWLVRVNRCPVHIPGRVTTLGRLAHYLSFAVASAPALAFPGFSPDVVFCVAPTLLAAPAALAAARLRRAGAWLHFQDIEIRAAFAMGMLRGKPAENAATALFSKVAKGFDRVSTICPEMAERLASLGLDPNEVEIVPNWADKTVLRLGSDPSDRTAARKRFRRTLSIPEDAFLILHSGSMGRKQGLDTLLRAAAKLPRTSRGRETVFLLCGEGPARVGLECMARDLGLNNVRFLDLRPRGEVPAMLAAADLHLVLQTRNFADLGLPSRLMNILASGGSLLATADTGSALASILEDNPGCGLLARPDDPKDLARVLAQAVQTPLPSPNRACLELALCRFDKESALRALEAGLLNLARP